MQIINDIENFPEDAKNCVIAIGNFDGIHKGHLHIIHQIIKLSQEKNIPSALITFEPHPASVLGSKDTYFKLTDRNKKIYLLEQTGIDFLIEIKFDNEFSSTPAISFINEILINRFQIQHAVVGYNFIFGKNREGNTDLLKQTLQANNIEFTIIDPVNDKGVVYSSTLVRNFLQKGDIQGVKYILGRNFTLYGKIIKGNQKGKSIGFPTANFEFGEIIRPRFGVYAVRAKILNSPLIYKAIANIGIKPTFDGKKELIEVYLFNFVGDIYGKFIEIELIDYIRPEIKFKEIDSLKIQIQKDCARALDILG